MILKDLLDSVSKEKRKKERVKTVQNWAVGMGAAAAVGVATGILFAPKSGKETREDLKKKAGNTVEAIKDTFHKEAKTVKDFADHAAQKAGEIIKDVHGKTEGEIKDSKDGSHEIPQDIHKIGEEIPNELNK